MYEGSGESRQTSLGQWISEVRCEDVFSERPEHLSSWHPGIQRCRDVSSESGRPPCERASRNPELRGCLKRKWPGHLSSGNLGIQSCEKVSGGRRRTTQGQGFPSQGSEDVPGGSKPDHYGTVHVRGQRCMDVSGGTGPSIMRQGISEVSLARMSQAKAV